jgi:sugar phosphate permease
VVHRVVRLVVQKAVQIGLFVRYVMMAAVMVVATATAVLAAAGDKPYTVGNYPVDATANDAVAAKEKALADGQQAALKSLFKRLVPVTAYPRI